MRVYLCCHSRDVAINVATGLRAVGHQIVSSWVSEVDSPKMDDPESWGKNAARNMKQIDEAEAVVVIASPDHISGTARVPGGKFVEAGYAINHALGSGGPMVVTLGGVENGMLYHPIVKHAKVFADLTNILRGY